MDIKSEIIKFAKSIDIEYIGFGDIEFDRDFIDRLAARRINGHLSGFEEEDANKRIDIKSILEDAQTIIAVAVPYRTADPDKRKPYFSKSSLGLDYHKVVKNKLELISNFIKRNFNAECANFTDIGPLNDREIARKCGIGFFGKNSNIITEKYGSFVFLGEIITNLYIDRDEPLESKCGDCNLCLKACPADALEGPSYVNGKRCLSYISQKKEVLSDYEMDKLNLGIYGCDVCQDVCPLNKGKAKSPIKEFYPEEWNIDIKEDFLLGMTNKEFRETYGRTSSGWRGKDNLKRNLIIAMGNSKNKEYIPLLKNYKNEKLEYYIERSIKKLEDGRSGKKQE